MKHLTRILFYLPIILVWSCAEDLDGFETSEREDINGFTVKWRPQTTGAQRQVVREILNNMVLVEGGVFTLGATTEQIAYARQNEYPTTTAKQTDFYICKYEVSDQQYREIIPWSNQTSDNLYISWDDWHTFMDILYDITGIRFNMPTESQWEYAARGGKYSQGYIYPGSDNLAEVWTDSYNVGSNTPNELGIYNMADLKSEWCLDFYESYGSQQMLFDRCVTSGITYSTGEHHVVRGGNYQCSGESNEYQQPCKTGTAESFGNFKDENSTGLQKKLDYRYCRTTARSYYHTSQYGTRDIGVRLVININQ